MRLGVHLDTVKNWEMGHTVPALRMMPKIQGFLGYLPSPSICKGSLAERLRAYRRRNGLTQGDLAKLLEMDKSSVRGWEAGEHRPNRRNGKRIEELLRSASAPNVLGPAPRPSTLLISSS